MRTARDRLIQFSHPDIPEANWLAMVAVCLQLDRRGVILFVERLADVKGLPLQLKGILHQHAIEKDRSVCRCLERVVCVERWRGPHDFVTLPLSWFAIRIHERSALLVNAGCLPVHVGRVDVRIENLEFVTGVPRPGGSHKDTAVSAGLAAAGDVLRDSPLDMELVILEQSLGLDVSRTRCLAHREYAVCHDPFCRGMILGRYPLVLVLAIE